jgi:putative superfamily III holin-X
MPTQETDRGGIGAAVKNVAGHASTWFRLEKELAALELKKKTVAIGLGIGLGIGAALFALYALGFLFATIAAALATFMDTWLALLTVTLFLLLVTGILGALAVNRLKHGTPLSPEQAIREAQLTREVLKGHVDNPH